MENIETIGSRPISSTTKLVLYSNGIVQSGTCLVIEFSIEQYNVLYDENEFKVTEDNRPCDEE